MDDIRGSVLNSMRIIPGLRLLIFEKASELTPRHRRVSIHRFSLEMASA